MSHRGASVLENFHSVGNTQILLGVGLIIVAAIVLYLKFGRDKGHYGREGFLSKLEHKTVKIGVTAGVAVAILGAAYLLGVI